jgi:hypothetical protein
LDECFAIALIEGELRLPFFKTFKMLITVKFKEKSEFGLKGEERSVTERAANMYLAKGLIERFEQAQEVEPLEVKEEKQELETKEEKEVPETKVKKVKVTKAPKI